MTWNWQHREWPDFKFSSDDFREFELKFFENAGIIHGSIQHFVDHEQKVITVEIISNEAHRTSEIEGEFLSHDSIQSSVRRQLGLQVEHRHIEPAEQGIAEMMVDLYKNFNSSLDKNSLFDWHQMLANGRRDLRDIGRYRSHKEPMQIVSGPIGRTKVHFEAPPSVKVPAEMDQFIDWFNQSGKGKKNELPALVRSAIAHLYFESIHPFEDGNGRIGRAISLKSLSQQVGRPVLLGLSQTISENKNDYYNALEENNRRMDISEWIHYFCQTILQAQDYTAKTINFVIRKGKFYSQYKDQLNKRQEKVVERIFREGYAGFKGGLSARNYQTISGAPSATATRDLTRLVEIGALRKTGELKGTRYYLNI